MEIIQEFINKGLIKKDEQIDFSQIQSVLAKSNKSIESAKMIMDNDPENSYQLADSKNAISSAITFLKEIESLIEDRNPQLQLK